MESEGQVGRGPDDEYCPGQTEGHHNVSHSVQAEPIRSVERCSLCGHISSAKLRAQLTKPMLGLATTRELLLELQARGDTDVVAFPTTELAEDGAILSGVVRGLLKALGTQTLGYSTEKGHPEPTAVTAHAFPPTVPAGDQRFA